MKNVVAVGFMQVHDPAMSEEAVSSFSMDVYPEAEKHFPNSITSREISYHDDGGALVAAGIYDGTKMKVETYLELFNRDLSRGRISEDLSLIDEDFRRYIIDRKAVDIVWTERKRIKKYVEAQFISSNLFNDFDGACDKQIYTHQELETYCQQFFPQDEFFNKILSQFSDGKHFVIIKVTRHD